MLYRVENLSKSSDKRLQDSLLYSRRERGAIGEIESSGWEDDTDENLFYLMSKTECLGVYHKQELEEVTEKQLQLETDLGALLSVFPNQNPSAMFGDEAELSDKFAIEALVPVLRKRYKKEFAAQRAIIKKFLSVIGF